MMIRSGLIGLAAVLFVASCGQKDYVLPGERLDIRAPFGHVQATPENKSAKIRLARQINHSSWTHRAGNPNHRIQHPAFSKSPALIWAAAIGEGNDRKHRITADPVAADGRIFTLDSRAYVSATNGAGETLWSRDLTPENDNSNDASGGGLAVVGGQLFVTTGFGGLSALNPADGSLIWQQHLEAPATGAPTVKGGIVYVVTRDARAWAIDASTGRVRWQLGATPSVAGIVGGAGPAVGGGRVIFPFGATQLVSAFPKGGLQIWRSSLAGERPGQAYAQLSDVSADPVIVGSTIYAGNPSGRVMAIDLTTGDKKWTAREGAVGPVWIEGGSVFLVSDQAELVRLSTRNGSRIWGAALPDFVPAKNERRQRDVYAHFGPVMAGGRLWVASSDGMLRGFNPVDGSVSFSAELPGGATSRPIIVDGSMYVVSGDGQLLAFR